MSGTSWEEWDNDRRCIREHLADPEDAAVDAEVEPEPEEELEEGLEDTRAFREHVRKAQREGP